MGVAAALGVHVEQAVVLEDWNNTIVRLDPASIVAKVGTSHFRDARLESLERELAVVEHLAARGAPVVPPARQVPPGPHRRDGFTVTLWQYVEPIPDGELAAAGTAAAIRLVHDALSDFDAARLPRFDVELDDARRLLQPERSPSLTSVDRRFLLGVVDELAATLSGAGGPAAAREPACGQLAPERGRPPVARFRDGVPWAGRVGSRGAGGRGARVLPRRRPRADLHPAPHAQRLRGGQVLGRAGTSTRGPRGRRGPPEAPPWSAARRSVSDGRRGRRRSGAGALDRRGLPLEPVRVGERPGVAADDEPVRPAPVLVDAGVLGEGAAPVQPERDGTRRLSNSTYLRPKLFATVRPRST